tara:strand:+ start:3539 stop:3958 length:420 start_codon:yes stop_codon:yes gene_type:complete
MIFFRFIIISIFFLFLLNVSVQAEEKNKELIEEEPLPLNDPFAGDSASASTLVIEQEPTTDAVKLRAYKLVASFSGKHQSFITLVNDSGEFMTLELFEELTEGLKLVDVNIKQAVFEKNEDNKFLIINFKNQIREADEY